jgi:glutaredoxin 3
MRAVTIYVTDSCPYCRQAERFLDAKGVKYKAVDVTEDPAMRAQLVELTSQRTVPQIFIGEESIGGYSDMVKLHQAGQLDSKLSA